MYVYIFPKSSNLDQETKILMSQQKLTIQSRTGVLLQKLKCLLPKDVSLANLNLSGSAHQIIIPPLKNYNHTCGFSFFFFFN